MSKVISHVINKKNPWCNIWSVEGYREYLPWLNCVETLISLGHFVHLCVPSHITSFAFAFLIDSPQYRRTAPREQERTVSVQIVWERSEDQIMITAAVFSKSQHLQAVKRNLFPSLSRQDGWSCSATSHIAYCGWRASYLLSLLVLPWDCSVAAQHTWRINTFALQAILIYIPFEQCKMTVYDMERKTIYNNLYSSCFPLKTHLGSAGPLCVRKQTKNWDRSQQRPPWFISALQQLSPSFTPQIFSVQTLSAKISFLNLCASALPADSVALNEVPGYPAGSVYLPLRRRWRRRASWPSAQLNMHSIKPAVCKWIACYCQGV